MNNPFPFDFEKAKQATGVLLHESGPKQAHNYTRIMKLLWLAERSALEHVGRPIIGDKIVAMDHGPVLSHVLDLIKNRSPHSVEWFRFIETDGYDIILKCDPGNGRLSKYEVELLQQMWAENLHLDVWQLCEKTHTEEWKKNEPPKGKKKDIPFEDVLKALNLEARLDSFVESARDSIAFRRLFG